MNKFKSRQIIKQQIKRLSHQPNAEVFAFYDTDEITLSNKTNYKVAINIVMESLRMDHIHSLFDTGAGSNLLREDIVEPDWMSSVPVYENLRLRCAMK